MALISCEECGRQISDRAVSCPGCGCPVDRAGERCPECGAAVNVRSTGCLQCGYPLSETIQEEAERQDGSNVGMRIGNPYVGKPWIVLGFLLILLGAVLFIGSAMAGAERMGFAGFVIFLGGVGMSVVGKIQNWWHWG